MVRPASPGYDDGRLARWPSVARVEAVTGSQSVPATTQPASVGLDEPLGNGDLFHAVEDALDVGLVARPAE